MHVVIIGAGFAGLAAARELGGRREVRVTVLDRRNYHLFQPLLYQVATAGLNPADIASPIRSILRDHRNIEVVQAHVSKIDRKTKTVHSSQGEFSYDRLIVATGSEHHYFGQDQWEPHAPGLKTLEGATEIRRRILGAFERAEATQDLELRQAMMRFVIVGAGPTGVELAGAIAQMAKLTLAQDFRHIDPRKAQVLLIEAGPRVLSAFDPRASARAQQSLEDMGVQVLLNTKVTHVDGASVKLDAGAGEGQLHSHTTIWAAGVVASSLSSQVTASEQDKDRQGRVKVGPCLSLLKDPQVYVIGDLAHAKDAAGQPLPAMAPVAAQQGRYVARHLLGRVHKPFVYKDKGIMATIGRNRAVVQRGGLRMYGFVAWVAWLVVHIFFLIGFRNRMAVLFQWAWSYLSYAKHARLIGAAGWMRSAPSQDQESSPARPGSAAARPAKGRQTPCSGPNTRAAWS